MSICAAAQVQNGVKIEEQVVFNVPKNIPVQEDVTVQYVLHQPGTPLDWIGIFRSGFKDTGQPLMLQWAPTTATDPLEPLMRIITFPASQLQTLDCDKKSYKFVYVNKDSKVLGVSSKFTLKRDTSPVNKLCSPEASDSWSESPVILSSDEEWEMASPSPSLHDNSIYSDLSDIVVLSTSPSKEVVKKNVLDNVDFSISTCSLNAGKVKSNQLSDSEEQEKHCSDTNKESENFHEITNQKKRKGNDNLKAKCRSVSETKKSGTEKVLKTTAVDNNTGACQDRTRKRKKKSEENRLLPEILHPEILRPGIVQLKVATNCSEISPEKVTNKCEKQTDLLCSKQLSGDAQTGLISKSVSGAAQVKTELNLPGPAKPGKVKKLKRRKRISQEKVDVPDSESPTKSTNQLESGHCLNESMNVFEQQQPRHIANTGLQNVPTARTKESTVKSRVTSKNGNSSSPGQTSRSHVTSDPHSDRPVTNKKVTSPIPNDDGKTTFYSCIEDSAAFSGNNKAEVIPKPKAKKPLRKKARKRSVTPLKNCDMCFPTGSDILAVEISSDNKENIESCMGLVDQEHSLHSRDEQRDTVVQGLHNELSDARYVQSLRSNLKLNVQVKKNKKAIKVDQHIQPVDTEVPITEEVTEVMTSSTLGDTSEQGFPALPVRRECYTRTLDKGSPEVFARDECYSTSSRDMDPTVVNLSDTVSRASSHDLTLVQSSTSAKSSLQLSSKFKSRYKLKQQKRKMKILREGNVSKRNLRNWILESMNELKTISSYENNSIDQSKVQSISSPGKFFEQCKAKPVNGFEQCKQQTEAKPVNGFEQCTLQTASKPVNGFEQCRLQTEAKPENVFEHCTLQTEAKPVNGFEQYTQKTASKPLNVLEKCRLQTEAKPVNVFEQCTQQTASKPVNFFEQCRLQTEAKPENIFEHCTQQTASKPVHVFDLSIDSCKTSIGDRGCTTLQDAPIVQSMTPCEVYNNSGHKNTDQLNNKHQGKLTLSYASVVKMAKSNILAPTNGTTTTDTGIHELGEENMEKKVESFDASGNKLNIAEGHTEHHPVQTNIVQIDDIKTQSVEQVDPETSSHQSQLDNATKWKKSAALRKVVRLIRRRARLVKLNCDTIKTKATSVAQEKFEECPVSSGQLGRVLSGQKEDSTFLQDDQRYVLLRPTARIYGASKCSYTWEPTETLKMCQVEETSSVQSKNVCHLDNNQLKNRLNCCSLDLHVFREQLLEFESQKTTTQVSTQVTQDKAEESLLIKRNLYRSKALRAESKIFCLERQLKDKFLEIQSLRHQVNVLKSLLAERPHSMNVDSVQTDNNVHLNLVERRSSLPRKRLKNSDQIDDVHRICTQKYCDDIQFTPKVLETYPALCNRREKMESHNKSFLDTKLDYVASEHQQAMSWSPHLSRSPPPQKFSRSPPPQFSKSPPPQFLGSPSLQLSLYNDSPKKETSRCPVLSYQKPMPAEQKRPTFLPAQFNQNPLQTHHNNHGLITSPPGHNNHGLITSPPGLYCVAESEMKYSKMTNTNHCASPKVHRHLCSAPLHSSSKQSYMSNSSQEYRVSSTRQNHPQTYNRCHSVDPGGIYCQSSQLENILTSCHTSPYCWSSNNTDYCTNHYCTLKDGGTITNNYITNNPEYDNSSLPVNKYLTDCCTSYPANTSQFQDYRKEIGLGNPHTDRALWTENFDFSPKFTDKLDTIKLHDTHYGSYFMNEIINDEINKKQAINKLEKNDQSKFFDWMKQPIRSLDSNMGCPSRLISCNNAAKYLTQEVDSAANYLTQEVDSTGNYLTQDMINGGRCIGGQSAFGEDLTTDKMRTHSKHQLMYRSYELTSEPGDCPKTKLDSSTLYSAHLKRLIEALEAKLCTQNK
ncbi:hypothetical protein Btru_028876 [Bulinus truncatus]|nr:hypothetical protein Btru_028876 [Bulinus truncatus]